MIEHYNFKFFEGKGIFTKFLLFDKFDRKPDNKEIYYYAKKQNGTSKKANSLAKKVKRKLFLCNNYETQLNSFNSNYFRNYFWEVVAISLR